MGEECGVDNYILKYDSLLGKLDLASKGGKLVVAKREIVNVVNVFLFSFF